MATVFEPIFDAPSVPVHLPGYSQASAAYPLGTKLESRDGGYGDIVRRAAFNWRRD